ncbi:hypothetical protein GIB67_038702 [Kingdonia uniflora]|uniref:ABC transmembrane type-1 domain-containing protein n=1 Tax=Kingdonia uniflora TaxID=39325 RepID=A0A7J7NSN4_9MAGN|nr:hypothetical protein GIB67_038702 [Kingdonia uniflora]
MDYFLMGIGSISAIVHGASVPVFFIFFGKLINIIGIAYLFPASVSHRVAKYSLDFLYLSIVILFSSWTEVACWMYTGERQAAKMRLAYLRSMLNQDISLFDTEASTGEVISAITSDIIVVQDAISEKDELVLKPLRLRSKGLKGESNCGLDFKVIDESIEPRFFAFVALTDDDDDRLFISLLSVCVRACVSVFGRENEVGNFMHYMSRFVAGFAIGFARVWQISLVTLSIVPLIAISGGVYAYIATGPNARVRKSYVKAGETAEEARLSNIHENNSGLLPFLGNWKCENCPSICGRRKGCTIIQDSSFKHVQVWETRGIGQGFGAWIHALCIVPVVGAAGWFTIIVVHKGIANGGDSFTTMLNVVISGL